MSWRRRRGDTRRDVVAPVVEGLLELQVASAATLRAIIEFQTAIAACAAPPGSDGIEMSSVLEAHTVLLERLGFAAIGIQFAGWSDEPQPILVGSPIRSGGIASDGLFGADGVIVGETTYRCTESPFEHENTPCLVVYLLPDEEEVEVHEHVRFGRRAVTEAIELWMRRVVAERQRAKRASALETMAQISATASSPQTTDYFALGPSAPRLIEEGRERLDAYVEQIRSGWGLDAVRVHGLAMGQLTLLAAAGRPDEEIDLPLAVDRSGGFPVFAPGAVAASPDTPGSGRIHGFRFNFRHRLHWGLLTVVCRGPLSEEDRVSLTQVAGAIGAMIEVAHAVNNEVTSNYLDRKTQRPNESVMFGALEQVLAEGRTGALVLLGFVDRLKYFESLDTLTLAGLFTATLDDLDAELVGHDGRIIAGILTGSILYVLAEGSFASAEEKDAFAERLRRATARPKLIGRGQRIQPEIAVGAVRLEPGRDVDAVVSRAYSALDEANERKSRLVEWAHQDTAIVRSKRLALEMEFKAALEQHQIVSFFQPEYSLSDGRLLSFESLVRWDHPERGLVGPNEFIPTAESSGLIVENDLQRLRHSVAVAVAWGLAEAGPEMRVNLSSATLHIDGLARKILDICDEEGLARSQLVVEVTETAILRNLTLAIAHLGELRDAGVGVALDDFGVGESSLARLRTLPVSIVKLDRQFVKPLPGDRSDRAFVEAVRTMIRSIDLDITAEGVENEAQRECLLAVGVDRAQGFLFSEPLPETEARRLLESTRTPPSFS